MRSLLWLFNTIVDIYVWMIIGNAILSILIQFGIINARQPFVQQVGEFLYRITEPLLAPIRRRLPDLGGIDISPLVLIIGLYFIRMLVNEMLIGVIRSM